MYGALVLKKLHSHGLNSIVEEKLLKLEFIILLLYVKQEVPQEWWYVLVVGQLIKVVFLILGVWEDIEMEDGTGLKLLIRTNQKDQFQDINIQLYFWDLWWWLLVVEQIK